jgi:peptidyl-prolyl cis-trans isomerase SurA
MRNHSSPLAGAARVFRRRLKLWRTAIALAKAVGPALIVLASVAGLTAIAHAEIIEQVLVKVNGEIFTKTDLEARQVARLREQGQRIDLKTNAGNAQLQKLLDQITPQIMVDAINEILVVQRGKELGYKLGDEQFKSVVESIRKENKLDTDEQFLAALKQENVSMADLRKNVERNMIFSRVQQNEVMSKIAMTDEEARAYYDAHLQEFTTPPSVTLREILVSVPTDAKGANVAADDMAKARAEAIRVRAVADGANFEQLAMDFSDAASRATGGLVGPINVGDLSADFRTIITAMKVGDVTSVLRTPRGYQILKLDASTPGVTQPFEQAKDRISDRVFTDKRRQEFDKYLAKLRNEAIIEWKNPELQKAYEAGLKQQKEQPPQPPAPAAAAPAKSSN